MGVSDDRLTEALALLREAGEAIRRLVLRGQVEPWADYPVLGDLDGRIRAFLAEPSPAPDPALTFTCPKCHRVSHNRNDARERYCGACHEWFPGEEAR